jgi:hypothetical protein
MIASKKEKTKVAVEKIRFPKTNVKFELDSADGFAFLGCARKMMGLEYNDCYLEVAKRNFTLNAKNHIRGVPIPKEDFYTYTLWACSEFLHEIDDRRTFKKIVKKINTIGQYPNGMFRYCNTETSYIVPNVTSAAALVYCLDGQYSKTKELVDLLRKTQKNGNWFYYEINKGYRKLKIKEDSMHLAMMIYHLREINRLSKLNTMDIVHKALLYLYEENKDKLEGGRKIEWGIPFIALASKGIEHKLYRRAFLETSRRSINHENFRTRAISAWALSKMLST